MSNRKRERLDLVAVLLLLWLLGSAVLLGVAMLSEFAQGAEPPAAAGELVTLDDIETPHCRFPITMRAGNRLIVTTHYTVSLNPQTKCADWCAFVVRPGWLDGRNALERVWIAEQDDLALEAEDYRESRFDRGHLCPLAAFRSSPHAWELNRMANVVPMRFDVNRGAWAKIEAEIRRQGRAEPVEVVCGTLYDPQAAVETLPQADEPHRVPSHLWIWRRGMETGTVAAAIIDQTAPKPAPQPITVEDLRQRCGLDLPP